MDNVFNFLIMEPNKTVVIIHKKLLSVHYSVAGY